MSSKFRSFEVWNPETNQYESAVALAVEPSPETITPVVESVLEEHKSEFVGVTDLDGTTIYKGADNKIHAIGGGSVADGVQYRVLCEARGTSSSGSLAYWDDIDKAWLYYSRVSKYDENKQGDYFAILKQKSDATIIHTVKSMFDGTDFPIKSGSLSVTDIKRWSNYYLVAVRSNEPNIPSDGVNNTSVWGYLLVLNADDLTVNASHPFNAKCSNVNVINTIYSQGEDTCWLVVSCQMSYFQIIKLAVTDNVVTLSDRAKTYFKAYEGTSFTDIHSEITEFQYAEPYVDVDGGKKLLISAGFGDGVHIVDLSNVHKTAKYDGIYSYLWAEHQDVMLQDYSLVGSTSKYGSTFSVAIDYPYVYCTFAQPTPIIQAYKDGLGDCRVQALLCLDITDLTNIQGTLHKIPLADCQSDTNGDPKPCTIRIFENRVFLGMGDKGIATFEVDGLNATYKGLTKVGKMDSVRYIDLNSNGELMCRNLLPNTFFAHKGNGKTRGNSNAYYSTIVDVNSIK